MPYVIRKEGSRWVVYKKGTRKRLGRHDSKAQAQAQVRAIYVHSGEEVEEAEIE